MAGFQEKLLQYWRRYSNMYRYIISENNRVIFESDLYKTKKKASEEGFGYLDALESINDVYYSMNIVKVN